MSNISKLTVTSRDYDSIYNELISVIPNVTSIWNSKTESDSGIILLKLMSMVGDMLSYNHDKAVLEVYPDTVKQRKNAAQVFALMGYKMRWYRSARCSIYISNNTGFTLTVPRFTKFSTKDYIVYTNVDEIEIFDGETKELMLYQGEPKVPAKTTNALLSDSNAEWDAIYTFNVDKEDIVNSRIYFDEKNVEESTIILKDNSDGYTGDEWIQTESLASITSAGKYYELRVDEQDRPYIKLIDYWNTFEGVTKFKLFYILSNGSSGEISENAIATINTQMYVDGSSYNDNDITFTNDESSYGYDPETPDEAREEASKYVNTYNTLITLADFTKATKRLNGVANCIATDFTCDVDYGSMSKYEIKLYVARTDEYSSFDKSEYYDYITGELKNFKILPLTIRVAIDEGDSEDIYQGHEEIGTQYFYWTISGTLYLKEPVTGDTANSIVLKINNALRKGFSLDKVEYNTPIKFIDVVNAIVAADSSINHVDLDPIEYYTDPNDSTSKVSDPKISVGGRYSLDIVSNYINLNGEKLVVNFSYPIKTRILLQLTLSEYATSGTVLNSADFSSYGLSSGSYYTSYYKIASDVYTDIYDANDSSIVGDHYKITLPESVSNGVLSLRLVSTDNGYETVEKLKYSKTLSSFQYNGTILKKIVFNETDNVIDLYTNGVLGEALDIFVGYLPATPPLSRYVYKLSVLNSDGDVGDYYRIIFPEAIKPGTLSIKISSSGEIFSDDLNGSLRSTGSIFNSGEVLIDTNGNYSNIVDLYLNEVLTLGSEAISDKIVCNFTAPRVALPKFSGINSMKASFVVDDESIVKG